MNTVKFSVLLIFTILSINAHAYGTSSSKKACAKPKFSEFTPPHLSVVAEQSEFSFKTSVSTNPDSIKVTVKKQPVTVSIDKISNSYVVKGKLPDSLKNTYARVAINATGTNNCKGNDGWLLSIKQ